ncbi:MAG: hypothetical protein CVU16_07855 [Betaproteobacteria bacterium HGW-Betaproteobacteria-10]|nr:MAG: hypothetical protein CVU16_07855 [Betaproteobacteria bacterium HGW-Betaproteobacteria-10]
MVHELEVGLFEGRVGTLALVNGRLRFCYAPGWLSLPNALALSASLPQQAQKFHPILRMAVGKLSAVAHTTFRMALVQTKCQSVS